MKKIKTLLTKVGSVLLNTVIICGYLVIFFIFLKIWEPFAPIVTFLIVLFLTIQSFAKVSTAILSLLGITTYVASWFTKQYWGDFVAVSTCGLGITIWLIAIVLSYNKPLNQKLTV
jgi:hypothetical protein